MAEADFPQRIDDPTRRFLTSLCEATAGDTSRQVSMYDIGGKIGMDRTEATHAAENIMAEGWAEVRTLSGKIGMTSQGLDVCQALSGDESCPEDAVKALGSERVLDAAARQGVERVVAEVKLQVQSTGLAFDTLAELVADLRTIDVQLASPRVKTAIIRACLDSVLGLLASAGLTEGLTSLKRLLA